MQQEGSTSMEQALAGLESELESTLKTAGAALSALKKARSAAQGGNLRDLQKTLDGSVQAVETLGQKVREVRDGWRFDGGSHMAEGGYLRELLDTARSLDLDIFEQDGLLFCYPHLVRILPGEQAVQIDKMKDRRIRPTALVKTLRQMQDRPVRFRYDVFLECLYSAYAMVRKTDGEVITLQALYRLLTLLPGESKEYSQQEFARDIYLLDCSGVNRTKNGHVMRLPASTATRSSRNAIRLITKDGSEKKYYGIAFQPE